VEECASMGAAQPGFEQGCMSRHCVWCSMLRWGKPGPSWWAHS